MKILKYGNLPPRKFVCNKCGCEFVMDMNEYSIIMSKDTILWHEADCPCCGLTTNYSEPWEEENEAGI